MNDLIPPVNSSEVLKDMSGTLGPQGIDVFEGQPEVPAALERGLENEGERGDEVQLDLTLGTLEKTDDLVRIYLCQMGAVPLLTREGEVGIAKRIERGQQQVLKALSRSPVVIHQILAIREDLQHGVGSLRDIVVFDEKEVTEEILQNRVKELTCRIDELQKHYKRASQLAERLRLSTIPSQKKGHQYRRCRCRLARERVRISLIILNLDLTNVERKRLIDQVNQTVDMMRLLDRQISDLEKKIESAQVLHTLPPREEKIMKMRFGLEDGLEHTLGEVGRAFAVTRQRIRQIEAMALRKLRYPSRSGKLRLSLDRGARIARGRDVHAGRAQEGGGAASAS